MFSEKERLLANEASLTSSLLGSGLNALRRADTYNKGLYYQAFFSLSIGIERLLKIIIINQHRCKNDGAFPKDIELKKLGHNLIELCEHTGISFTNSLHIKIIEFLGNFSMKARYYNIDFMVDIPNKYADPLKDWDLIEKCILKTVPHKKTVRNKEILAGLLDEVSVIRQHDLQGNLMTSAMDLLNDFEARDTIQGYSTQLTFEIITVLANKVRALEREKYLMPVLSEFFVLFHNHWKPFETRRKKNWLRT